VAEYDMQVLNTQSKKKLTNSQLISLLTRDQKLKVRSAVEFVMQSMGW